MNISITSKTWSSFSTIEDSQADQPRMISIPSLASAQGSWNVLSHRNKRQSKLFHSLSAIYSFDLTLVELTLSCRLTRILKAVPLKDPA